MAQRYISLLLELLEESDHNQRRMKAEQLWHGVVSEKSAPLTSGNRAYFFFYGKAESVSIAGDWTYWQPGAYFNRVENTDLFYSILEFHPSSRLQYKLIIDGDWRLDPANPLTSVEGFGVNSEFLMSGYKDNSWLQPHGGHPRKGRVERLLMPPKMSYPVRELFLYTPHESYRAALPDGKLPLLLVHDGAESLRIGHFHTIADNLIAAKKIEPFAAVFLSPADRIPEYALDGKYPEYCAREVVPFAIDKFTERNIHISQKTSDTSVIGASLGGLLSTKTALQFPDVFGGVIAQSPSYWWNQGEIFRSQYLRNAHDISFILQTGTVCDAQRLTQMMYMRLNGLGAKVRYSEFQQGHTWGNWRTNFAEALINWKPALEKMAA